MAEDFTKLLVQEGIWSSTREEYATEKMERLSKLLQMYSPNYALIHKPQGVKIDTGLARYAIVEHRPGHQPHVIRWITEPAMEDPQSLVDWVAAGDLNRHNPKELLARFQAEEDLVEATKERERRERYQAEDEITTSIIRGGRNRLHSFRHGGKTYGSNV